MVVREMIATARERIAKLREAKRMVGARGGAERQREQGAAAQHIQGGSSAVSVGFPLLWNDSASAGKSESHRIW